MSGTDGDHSAGQAEAVDANVEPARDHQGARNGAVAGHSDITHLRRLEAELRATEERFRVALQSTAVPFVLLAAVRDEAGRIIDFEWSYVNEAAATLNRRRAEDMVGRRIGELLPGRWQLADGAFDMYVRVTETGRPEDREFFYEYGEVRGWFHVIAAKHRDGVSLWAADMTRLRTALDDAVSTRKQLEAITSLMDAGVTRCTADLRYDWVSPRYAKWINSTPAHMAGRPIRAVVGEAAFERLLPKFERVLAGERVEYEEEVEFQGIGARWIRAAYVPSRNEQGVVDAWVAVVTDITERKKLELSLVAADRRKDEFLSMLAHELRNPLAAISNVTHLLQQPTLDGAGHGKAAEVLSRQVAHLSRLVDDLLDVARITRGQINLKREPTGLAQVIEHAVESSRPFLNAKKQQISVSLSVPPAMIDGDPARLAQVFGNLLHNASKYSAAGSNIHITASVEGQCTVVRVRDEGVGIRRDLLPHVFDLFHRSSESIDRDQGGLGIGLTLVRKLVELHGGSVEARSEGPGKGSEFIVRLPLTAAPLDRERSDGRKRGEIKASGNVMVVDDNVDARESLALLLHHAGYDVRLAADGQSALHAFRASSPEVVLLDIGLPEMDGYAVAREMRKLDTARRVRLIALTGYARDEDRRRAMEAGFDAHLKKPVQFEELLQELQNTPVV
jgi:two-component system CheB/CheR fusion protein